MTLPDSTLGVLGYGMMAIAASVVSLQVYCENGEPVRGVVCVWGLLFSLLTLSLCIVSVVE